MIDEERMKECTFQPQRITVTAKKRAAPASSQGATDATPHAPLVTGGIQKEQKANIHSSGEKQSKRFEALYALAKGHQQKDKTDKSKEDYEFEKSKGELTFQPKLLAKAGGNSATKKMSDPSQQQSHEKSIIK